MTPTREVQKMLNALGYCFRRLTERLERGTEFEVICELHAIEDEARQARTELSKPRGTT